MSRTGSFADLRKVIDDAITYGAFSRARQLAEKGYRQARTKELLGEMAYFKGQLAILSGDFEGAIEWMDKAVEFNPHDGAAYNDRALCMVELNNISGAFLYFNKGIEVESDYATVYHNKGWLLNKTGKHTEAIRYFRKALELDPDRPVTYENMGNAFYRMGDRENAILSYQKALQLLKAGYRQIRKQIEEEIKVIKEERAARER